MKNKILLPCVAGTLTLLAGCVSTGEIATPDTTDYGLYVYSSYNGRPIIVGSDTQTLDFNNRIYYFQDMGGLKKFQADPQLYMLKYAFNQTPKIVKPLDPDYGLRTNCSYNGDPIVIGKFTPTLEYLGRIYYFAHTESMDLFIDNPLVYIAKYPSDKVPTIISPLKSSYGKKTVCATTGTQILVGPHTPALEYMGRIFYFSTLQAMESFQYNPQSYIAQKFNQEEI